MVSSSRGKCVAETCCCDRLACCSEIGRPVYVQWRLQVTVQYETDLPLEHSTVLQTDLVDVDAATFNYGRAEELLLFPCSVLFVLCSALMHCRPLRKHSRSSLGFICQIQKAKAQRKRCTAVRPSKRLDRRAKCLRYATKRCHTLGQDELSFTVRFCNDRRRYSPLRNHLRDPFKY